MEIEKTLEQKSLISELQQKYWTNLVHSSYRAVNACFSSNWESQRWNKSTNIEDKYNWFNVVVEI